MDTETGNISDLLTNRILLLLTEKESELVKKGILGKNPDVIFSSKDDDSNYDLIISSEKLTNHKSKKIIIIPNYQALLSFCMKISYQGTFCYQKI